MTTVDVLAPSGDRSGTVELPAEIFDAQVNIPLIHQVVVAQLAAARQGTHATKSRGDVSGGGRKPYRQKGTGRARQGSIRAPQFSGGGVVHGPTPHDYVQRTPKKMKAAALRGALSDRAREGRVHVVEAFLSGDTPSTKSAVAVLGRLTERPRALVVLARDDSVAWRSLRNVADIHLLAVDQLNTYDVLRSDDVVFTQRALERFISGGAQQSGTETGTETKVSLAEDTRGQAVEVPESDAPFGPGSAAPAESGEAPEGYSIKGNTSSMKYHPPESRWYEQTIAEVWFATTDDAERAGFTRAGSRTGRAKDGAEGDGGATGEEDAP